MTPEQEQQPNSNKDGIIAYQSTPNGRESIQLTIQEDNPTESEIIYADQRPDISSL
jgi:hypothetical protein